MVVVAALLNTRDKLILDRDIGHYKHLIHNQHQHQFLDSEHHRYQHCIFSHLDDQKLRHYLLC